MLGLFLLVESLWSLRRPYTTWLKTLLPPLPPGLKSLMRLPLSRAWLRSIKIISKSWINMYAGPLGRHSPHISPPTNKAVASAAALRVSAFLLTCLNPLECHQGKDRPCYPEQGQQELIPHSEAPDRTPCAAERNQGEAGRRQELAKRCSGPDQAPGRAAQVQEE